MPGSSQPKWTDIKPKLASLDQKQLIEVIKALCDLSPENRLFLAARLSPETVGATAIEPYRKRITDQFFPSRGFGKLNLRDARQAIRDYKKATSDLAGTLDLMLEYIENGSKFINSYGDINESFYDSAYSVMKEITELLQSPQGQPLYPLFEKRLRELTEDIGGFGYGYGDDLKEFVQDLEAFFANR